VKCKQFLRCKCRFLSRYLRIISRHSWIPISHPIRDLRFWSHANNLTLWARIFCSCRHKMIKLHQGCWSSYEKGLWNRVETTFFTTGGWNPTGTITVNEMISFFIHTGCCTNFMNRKIDFHFLVLRVSFSALLQLHAKRPSQFPHM